MSTISPHTTRGAGTILTATIYNNDHVNHVLNATNLNIDKIEGATPPVTDQSVPVFAGTGGNALGPSIIRTSSTGVTLDYSDDSAGAGPTFTTNRISASPAANDTLGQLNFQGRDSAGNTVVYAAVTAQISDPTDTSEDGILRLQARINDVNSIILGLSAAGILARIPGLTFGFLAGQGVGNSVTQATSKSTGVTLDHVTGAITMNAASLASNTTVDFTLTNSTIAANDIILVTHKSGGTNGAYKFDAKPAAGSATISVRNVTGSPLGEAIVLSYMVFRAVIT